MEVRLGMPQNRRSNASRVASRSSAECPGFIGYVVTARKRRDLSQSKKPERVFDCQGGI